MFKKIYIFILPWVCGIAYGNDCIKYKHIPNVSISSPIHENRIVQPDEPMDKLHGNVLATLIQDFDLVVDIIMHEGGYCVVLKKVDATVGYNDFLVSIDKSHRKGSCTYSAIINHEKKHVDAYLSVINDMKSDIQDSVFNAANSVMPVFADSREKIDSVIENMNYEIQSHPEVILIKQKINAAQEIRNKRVDQKEDNIELKICLS